MNRIGADSGGEFGTPIDLAREAPFVLGELLVTPSTLSVTSGDWVHRLEPRTMKALVVLAQASPAVVGRGELNARVWSGRIVGEDAINRAVQTLRRIAADAPPPEPFVIETVPRVGYRLTAGARAVVADPPPVRAPAADTPVAPTVTSTAEAPPIVRQRSAARRLVVGGATAVAAVAAIVAWRADAPRSPVPAAWSIARSATLDDVPPGARDVALSPDGRRLAYRGHDARGRERIFVRGFGDSGAGRAVSPADIDARRPAWSPDSAALAFAAYDGGRPCRLYVQRADQAAAPVGACETVRDPRLAWSADGGALVFGDATGENAVQRISAVRLADGRRLVLSDPPGDSMGDGLPVPRRGEILFQRQFGWADEGWIARDAATGRERLLWRRSGVAGSVAAPLPDGGVAIAWTRAGASGLDLIDAGGHVRTQPVALGTVTAMSVAGSRLLVESDHGESVLSRAGGVPPGAPLAAMRGRIFGAVALPDGRLQFVAASAGVARIWERDTAGSVRPWGSFVAARITGLTPSADGRFTAALVTGNSSREIELFDAAGKPIYRWNPRARSVNSGAWSADGHHLIVPMLDGAGWRLVTLDPFGGAPPRDLDLPGFAVVQSVGAALYAVRAGEATGIRELWRLDGDARRLPIDLTLFDIVNWRAVDGGIWLPDRSDRDHPRLVLRDIATGRVVRSIAAPGLAGAGSGLAADAKGPIYVQVARDSPEYSVLTLSSS